MRRDQAESLRSVCNRQKPFYFLRQNISGRRIEVENQELMQEHSDFQYHSHCRHRRSTCRSQDRFRKIPREFSLWLGVRKATPSLFKETLNDHSFNGDNCMKRTWVFVGRTGLIAWSAPGRGLAMADAWFSRHLPAGVGRIRRKGSIPLPCPLPHEGDRSGGFSGEGTLQPEGWGGLAQLKGDPVEWLCPQAGGPSGSAVLRPPSAGRGGETARCRRRSRP